VKISTEIASAAKIIGEEKAVEYVAKAGFDAWDFSMFAMCKYDWENGCILENDHVLASDDYIAFARRLRKIGEDNGIVCNQSHAPFPTCCKEVRSFYKRAIECSAEAGAEICIIHPDNYKSAEENAEMYFELLPFAKEHNVKIATENMWNWNKERDHAAPAACSHHDNFVAHIKAVNDPYLVACLDIGHAEMKGLDTTAEEMIYALGDSVAALHLHDNDRWHDSHALPFTMDIDFDKVIKALKKIDYKGYMTLESNSYLKSYTEENILEGMKNMAAVARKLAEMYEQA
jgi:sugar phosphate isomerase/epimerase